MAASGLTVNALVTAALGQKRFRVRLENSMECICHVAGKLSKHSINVLVGDKVTVELSEYDLTRGRIIYRMK